MFFKNFTILCCFVFFISCDPKPEGVNQPSKTPDSSSVLHSYHPANQETIGESAQNNVSESEQTISNPAVTANANDSSQDNTVKEQTISNPPVTASANESSQDDSIKDQTTDPSLIINYDTQSIGEIDLNITKEKANQTLTVLDNMDSTYFYEEGIQINWDEKGEATYIQSRQGTLVHNNEPLISLGESIPMDGDYTQPEIIAQNITQVLNHFYNVLENTKINCFEEKKCFLKPFEIPNAPPSFQFFLPKMNIIYSLYNKAIFFIGVQFERESTSYDYMLSLATPPKNPVIVNYNQRSIGEIDFNITEESANEMLTLVSSDSGLSEYKEGFTIEWSEEGKALKIFITTPGGRVITDNNKAQLIIGSSPFIPGDKWYEFFIGIYNAFENTKIDCFEEKKCGLTNSSAFGMTGFLLPNMEIWIDSSQNILQFVGFDLENKNYNDLISYYDTQAQADSEDQSDGQDTASQQTQDEASQNQNEQSEENQLALEDQSDGQDTASQQTQDEASQNQNEQSEENQLALEDQSDGQDTAPQQTQDEASEEN